MEKLITGRYHDLFEFSDLHSVITIPISLTSVSDSESLCLCAYVLISNHPHKSPELEFYFISLPLIDRNPF